MATLVFFHAHPDDESISTAGTMAQAARDGHDVVLVVATHGEKGEPVPGVLRPGEELWQRRVEETHRSAELLGARRVEFLGYEDSDMMGREGNENPRCFWQADLDEAAGRLAEILGDVGADVLSVYDDHGGYGHPDHIQVHRAGHRAAQMAGVEHVFEVTMNRDHIIALMESEPLDTEDGDAAERLEQIRSSDFGTPEALITHALDVNDVIDIKRAAMMAHASQIAEDSFFLAMPPEAFAAAFGREWYMRPGHPRPADAPFASDLLEPLTEATG